MLRNHGLLTVGRSVAETFVSMYLLETARMIQVRAPGGGLAWPALLRRLDRLDPGYRT